MKKEKKEEYELDPKNYEFEKPYLITLPSQILFGISHTHIRLSQMEEIMINACKKIYQFCEKNNISINDINDHELIVWFEKKEMDEKIYSPIIGYLFEKNKKYINMNDDQEKGVKKKIIEKSQWIMCKHKGSEGFINVFKKMKKYGDEELKDEYDVPIIHGNVFEKYINDPRENEPDEWIRNCYWRVYPKKKK